MCVVRRRRVIAAENIQSRSAIHEATSYFRAVIVFNPPIIAAKAFQVELIAKFWEFAEIE